MPLTLSLALHNHQPVGNFPAVFEQAYRQAYEPMITALERHPRIRLALHYSGPVLDWVRETHPELLDRIRTLVARNQVEIMTGGYYEPILPAIPDRDKRAQIARMTAAISHLFGYEAAGLWLAERVWEPHLPRPLAAARIAYTIVDDAHFFRVGLPESALTGYFVTEECGARLAIFPSLKALRYRIPWAPVDDVMRWLRARAGGQEHVLVMGDDGEKFGLWPGTYALCWERGWVESFFAALEAAGDWLALASPGEWLRAHPPRGRIYLPSASYDEMTEWALPADGAARLPALKHDLEAQGRSDLLPFLQGGFWRHFMVKYPEINTLHKTMLRVSRKVWSMPRGPRRDQALDHLWQAQCNCPYWHGVFGGIYLGHIRAANYAHLIEAERLADATGRRGRWVTARRADLDADARPEVLVSTDAQVLSIDPADGGSVVTWDLRAARVNLVNVMTRRAEGYHETLRQAAARGEVVLYRPDETETIHTARVRVKERGLERYLIADWYRRSSLIDHFLAPGAGPHAFVRGEARELGDFVDQPFEASVTREPDRLSVRLTREGHVWVDGVHAPVRVEKTLTISPGSSPVEVAYLITNRSASVITADFAVETNWGVASPQALINAVGEAHRAGSVDAVDGVEGADLRDAGWGCLITTSPPCSLWIVPIEIVSASEAGFERTFQGVSLLSVWPVRLPAAGVWDARLSFAPRAVASPEQAVDAV